MPSDSIAVLSGPAREDSSPRAVWIYAAVLSSLASLIGAALILSSVSMGPPLVVLGLAAAAAFAERGS